MAFVQKPNNGALFKNTRKKQPNHPDWTGSINVEGDDFYLNGWVKETKDGQKYFSLSIKPKDSRKQDEAQSDDDIF